MKLALYKGRAKLFNRLVSWWLSSPYSHAEIVFSDGMCGSSSMSDGGVRLKRIDLDPHRWDLVDIRGDESQARAWFEEHAGEGYDFLGLLGFVWRRGTQDKDKSFCFEACGESLGSNVAWQMNGELLKDVYGK